MKSATRRHTKLLLLTAVALLVGRELLFFRERHVDYSIMPELRATMSLGDLRRAREVVAMGNDLYCLWTLTVACECVAAGLPADSAQREAWRDLIATCCLRSASSRQFYLKRHPEFPEPTKAWLPNPGD
jgi:hypothetical protein